MTHARPEAFRRGAREIVDDATDRVRGGAVPVLLLHVLPSLPFVAAAIAWFVDVDLRGARPEDASGLVFLLVPKMLGWAALAAWAARAGRGHEAGIAAAWVRTAARLPEALLATSAALLGAALSFTLLAVPAIAAGGVALAATVSDRRTGLRGMVQQASDATLRDAGRWIWILAAGAFALLFLSLNLVLLPVGALMLGGGALGLDLHLVIGVLSPLRAATWAAALMLSGLLVEAVVVVAFVELQIDREEEKEGTRFERFVDDLEARDGARDRARDKERTAARNAARGAAA